MHAHITLDEAAVDVVDDDGRIVLDLTGVTAGGATVAARLRAHLGRGLAVRD